MPDRSGLRRCGAVADEIWVYDVYPPTCTVDDHIARLRKKIEDAPELPRYIVTVRSADYRFEADGIDPVAETSRLVKTL